MKKINDRRLYLFFSIVVLVLALLVAAPSFYSILLVEPDVENFLSAKQDINRNYKDAYIILRSPHIFGKYEHFDTEGISVKNSIMYFDRMIYSGQDLLESHRQYIEVILDRRKKASRLGRYTTFFLLILSFISGLCFLVETKKSTSRPGV